MADLIKPKDFIVEDSEGQKLTFILSNFPAVEGREIIAKYPTSNLPKVGDYAVSEETMFKLMGYVAVRKGDVLIRLTTRDLVNNHCPDTEVLMKIEAAMMEKNYSFFRDGRSFDFLERLVQAILLKISEISIRSSEPSSPMVKPL